MATPKEGVYLSLREEMKGLIGNDGSSFESDSTE